MNFKCKFLGVAIFLCATSNINAQAGFTDQYAEGTNKNTQDLVKYLQNLGAFLGYNITKEPSSDYKLGYELLDGNKTQLGQTYALYTLLGAMPVNAISQNFSQFVPSGQAGIEGLNTLANYVFNQQNYSTPSSQGDKVSVNILVDQKQFQNDPVSQGVLNILGTPSNSYCMDYSNSSWNSKCDYLYQGKVASNVLGEIPSTNQFFSYEKISAVLPMLNSNSLLGPLLLDSSTSNQGTSAGASSSASSGDNSDKGLTAENQTQAASNFIRYLSSAVTPLELPDRKTYDTLYLAANNKNLSESERQAAKSQLANYITRLRTYAARASVSMSNFYYMLSKRMPQNQNTEGSQQGSQALTEFTMATRRLYNPDMSTNQQWINSINQASSATVQKEIAVLLAEINYQLYLNRQQQERILITNSALLLQTIENMKPDASTLTSSQ